ncbi:MAG: phosphoribosyltransferase [Caldilineaceae bacterium]
MFYLADAYVRPFFKTQMKTLRDRADAGRQLAQKLTAYAERSDVLVLGLARGGIPVAYEIAKALHVPLDVLIVRKLGVPGHEELAMGAIASGGIRVLNASVVENLAIPPAVIDQIAEMETAELTRRAQAYGGASAPPEIVGKTIILVDDGIATGATLRAAIAALRTQNPARIVVAVGVVPPETYDELCAEVEEFVSILRPAPFWGVGLWFDRFSPTSDEEVRTLLARAKRHVKS